MLNLVFPFLNGIDQGLSFLPLIVRVAVYGLVAGALSILVYKWTSNQKAIAALKEESKGLRNRLMDPNLSGTELKNTILRNTKVSGILVGRVLGPSLLSAIPVVVLAGWLALFHAYEPPAQGEPVTAVPVPAREGLTIEAGATETPLQPGGTSIEADRTTTVTIRGADQAYYTGRPFAPALGGVGKRAWWNTLLDSEIGYLADDAPIEAVEFDLQPVILIPGLPSWLAGWEGLFFLMVFTSAIGLKIGLKIE